MNARGHERKGDTMSQYDKDVDRVIEVAEGWGFRAMNVNRYGGHKGGWDWEISGRLDGALVILGHKNRSWAKCFAEAMEMFPGQVRV